MKHIILLLFLFLTTVTAQGETLNTCHDQTVNKEWQRLMAENGHHPEWQAMYRIRKQLCKAVDNGQLTVEEATYHFEEKRKQKIKQLKERLEKEHGEYKVSA